MNKKKCNQCRKLKPITEFSFYNKKEGLRISVCKNCKKESYNERMKDPEYRKKKCQAARNYFRRTRFSEEWNIGEKKEKLLITAWDFIQSVPYKVSNRWLFYRLLQAGFYNSKSQQGDFSNTISTARRKFYKGKRNNMDWRPDTLEDETREFIHRTDGYAGREEVIENIYELVSVDIQCDPVIDHFYHQEYYVEIWFEARAMIAQFEYYTEKITLRPFGGQMSTAPKWFTAEELTECSDKYEKPIIILYFGDLDEAGSIIEEAAIGDIKWYCDVDFEVIRCGLTEKQVAKYDIDTNPDRPIALSRIDPSMLR